MSKKTADKGLLSDFFEEGTEKLLGIGSDHPEATPDPQQEMATFINEPPSLPVVRPASEAGQKTYWRRLRNFFRSGKSDDLPFEWSSRSIYPALLSPFRKQKHLSSEYPLWVADRETFQRENDPDPNLRFSTLKELLRRSLDRFARSEHEAIILKDNLTRLEMIIRKKLKLVDAAFKAPPVFDEALEELQKILDVKGREGEVFATDILRLKEGLPKSGILIPASPNAPMILLAALTDNLFIERRENLKTGIGELSGSLRDILSVEREKSPEARSPQSLKNNLDFAGDFINFEALSSVLPESTGSEEMPADRKKRIETALATLSQADQLLFNQNAVLIVDEDLTAKGSVDWKEVFPDAFIEEKKTGKLCSSAVQSFDRQMSGAATFFAALRIARLELTGRYIPEIHQYYFDHFTWMDLSEEELDYCTPVFLIASETNIKRDELNEYSKLLSSGRPVKAILFQEPETAEAEISSSNILFQQELGAIATAHRNGYVLQASPMNATILANGFRYGIQAATPALFLLFRPPWGETTFNESFLWASAAVEGRAFPGFSYDSGKGPRWGSRFDVSHNPQPEADWPVHTLPVIDPDGERKEISIPFTFADFAAQEPFFRGQFQLVPPEFWNDDLIEIGQFLTLSPEEAYAKAPYIWVVDQDNVLQRAAVAWPVVRICRERLDFWHYLQENAGVHSYHAELASEKMKAELTAQTEREIAALKAEQIREVERVKEETARKAMEQLAAALLNLDTETIISDALPSKVSSPVVETPKPAEEAGSAESSAPAPEPAAEEEEIEILELGEPWIETPLCTSCNECINLNGRIFKYNADKQAYIADPAAGPFSDIVKAAEKCPAKIIHPGAPLNPNEEGVEEWMKKAEPFN